MAKYYCLLFIINYAGRQVKQTRRAWDNFRETLPQVQDSPEHIIDFFKQLQLIDPNTVIFLPGNLFSPI